MSSSKANRFPIYCEVGVDERLSSSWQLWTHWTSVYLVNEMLPGVKVSLHGWDSRFPGGGHFRVERAPGSVKAGKGRATALLGTPRAGWPVRFTGAQRGSGTLAVRIRTLNSACTLPTPPERGRRKSAATMKFPWPGPVAGRVELYAADLDLTFGQVPAGFDVVNEFPNFFRVGHADSMLYIAMGSEHPRSKPGFMVHNGHGAVLRGTTTFHLLQDHPTPPHLLDSTAGDGDVRGVRIDVDDDGVLWIVEQAVGAPQGA